MRTVVYDIREGLVSDVLFAAVESGKVRRPTYEWGREDMTAYEKVMHPLTTFHFGHDSPGVGNTGGLEDRGLLFGAADIFALIWIEWWHCYAMILRRSCDQGVRRDRS